MPLRDMDREQMWLLPPSLDELLPLDHPARFVAVFVDALDKEGWAELGVEINGDPLGAPAYHPRALLCVWLYGFMTGVRSCRKLEAACRDQIPYLWLTGWQQPDHNTLWRFYKEHRQAMRRLFKRTVRTAVAMQLVDLAVQAVDGTKVAANATRDRTYDAERGRRLLDRLEKAIEDLEAQNEGGEDAPAVHLPEELADKRALREQVRQAMDDLASQEGLRHINLTDKDARLMKTRHGIVPGYNAQSMVSPIEVDDEASGMLITAVDVVDDPTDYGQFTPMLEQAEETTGTKACMTLADAGYYSGSNLSECAGRGQGVAMPETSQRQSRGHPYHKDRFAYDESSDRFMCPQGKALPFERIHISSKGAHFRFYRAPGAVCRACPAFGVCTKSKNGRNVSVGPKVDGEWRVAGSGAGLPGPGQQLAAHPVQLADVAPGEAAQEGAQGGWRFDYAAESAGRPAGAQRIGVVDAVAARQRRGDQRHYLVAGVGSAWGPAQVQVPVNQLGKAEVQGQGGGKNQPGIVDQAVVVEGDVDAVGLVA